MCRLSHWLVVVRSELRNSEMHALTVELPVLIEMVFKWNSACVRQHIPNVNKIRHLQQFATYNEDTVTRVLDALIPAVVVIAVAGNAAAPLAMRQKNSILQMHRPHNPDSKQPSTLHECHRTVHF